VKSNSAHFPAAGVWCDVDGGRCGSASFPSLVRRGGREAPGVVCTKSRSILIDAREALLINRYCSTLNRPPQPSLREGIPALLRRGIWLNNTVPHPYFSFMRGPLKALFS
jgi:hypothetical protein